MKKIVKMTLAALCAAVLTGSAVTAPVCAADAEKHYVLGDVDMDGKIDLKDALTAIQEYTDITLFHKEEHVLTGEAFALAKTIDNDCTELGILDAFGILMYYTRKQLEGNETVTWKTLFGEEYFAAHIDSIDRGDYELIYDEAVGDYVIVKKG
jgi:hypothetical protein